VEEESSAPGAGSTRTDLLDTAEAAGLRIELDVDGEPRALPARSAAGVHDLAAIGAGHTRAWASKASP
jgi:hypothetical protein